MRRNRGFVLAVALMAIVVIAVIVTGALFATAQETHSTETLMLQEKAFAYSELAAYRAIGTWNNSICDSLVVGAVLLLNPPAEPPFESAVYITRLDSALFLVVGEGRIASRGVTRMRRRVAITVRILRAADGASRVSRLSEHAWAALYQM